MVLPRSALLLLLVAVPARTESLPAPDQARSALGAPRLLGDLATVPDPVASEPGPVPLTVRVPVSVQEADAPLWFAADDERHGRELWSVAPGGEPRRLTDLCPGPCDGVPDFLPVVSAGLGDGRLLLAGDDGETGRQLWITDGSAEGTQRLTPAGYGGTGVVAVAESAWAGEVYFGYSGELWRTDGTGAGTERVVGSDLGLTVPGDALVVRIADRIVFTAVHEATGRELWSSDGTAGGTVLLADHCPGACGTGIDGSGIVLDDAGEPARLVLRSVAAGRQAVWSTAGTPATTRVLREICEGCSFFQRPLTAVGDLLVFSSRREVWGTDGTPEGTRHLATLEDPFEIVGFGPASGDLLVFGWVAGFETGIWRVALDGPLPGRAHSVATVGSFVPRVAGLLPEGPVLFSASDEAGYEPWSTDGTPSGTARLDDLDSGPGSSAPGLFTSWGDGMVFVARHPTLGFELFGTDATSTGTSLLADLAGSPGSSNPGEIVDAGGRAFFATEVHTEVEDPHSFYDLPLREPGSGDLWTLADDRLELLLPGRLAHGLTPVGPRLFFAAQNRLEIEQFLYQHFDFEPWVSDGTPAGTRLLGDLEPGPAQSFPRDAVLLPTPDGDRIVFFADRGPGAKIWTSDGSPEGTSLLVDIDPEWDNVHVEESCVAVCSPPYPATPIYPRDARVAGGRLFFVGRHPDSGEELWTSDGTATGTRSLDVVPGEASSYPDDLTVVGDRLFLSTSTAPEGLRDLWVTEGSTGTLRLLATDFPALDGAAALTSPEGPLLGFLVGTGEGAEPGPSELWTSDGTPSGTGRVAILDGVASALSSAEDRVWFTVRSDAFGTELAVSDGTAAGTRTVVDLWPGPRGSAPRILAPSGRDLVFAASAGEAGTEPWISDGTPEGTVRLSASTGPRLVAPNAALAIGQRLLLAADDGRRGREPWLFEPGDTVPELCVPDSHHLCLGGRFRVSVDWRVPASGAAGAGRPVVGTAETGYFWFFGPDNLELAVKVVDGIAINDHHWLFYGALTDVEYTLRAEDLLTGVVQTYTNPSGSQCGGADVGAFPEASRAPTVPEGAHPVPEPRADGPEPLALPFLTCGETPEALCLHDRFEVTAVYVDQDVPQSASPVPFGPETGMFWFFSPDNVGAVVKVLDGRPVNGRWWVFHTKLSDLEVSIRVRDTDTGDARDYVDPAGSICGGSDLDAF